MASNYWAKVWIEMLDDPKVARLEHRLWRRFVEFILIAKERNELGLLPSLEDMAWRLRCSDGDLQADLDALAAADLMNCVDGIWRVTNFSKRQDPVPDADRQRLHRENERKKQYHGDGYTSHNSNEPVTNRNVETETDQNIEAETETETDALPALEPNRIATGIETPVPTRPTLTQDELDTPDPAFVAYWEEQLDEIRLACTRMEYDTYIPYLQPVRTKGRFALFKCAYTEKAQWVNGRWKSKLLRYLPEVSDLCVYEVAAAPP